MSFEVFEMTILKIVGFLLVMVGVIGFFLGMNIAFLAPAIGVGIVDLFIVTFMLSNKAKPKKG